VTGSVLTTERLVLRPLRLDDVDALVELDADPEVMRYLTGGAPTPRSDIERDLPTWLDVRAGVGRLAALVDGRFIGWFALRPPPPGHIIGGLPGDLELGYRIRRDAWGHGYATEGGRALVAHGFRTLDVPRIVATTMTVNLASRRVMEKVGLRFLNTFHLEWDDPIDGADQGEVLYGLTRAEFEAPA